MPRGVPKAGFRKKRKSKTVAEYVAPVSHETDQQISERVQDRGVDDLFVGELRPGCFERGSPVLDRRRIVSLPLQRGQLDVRQHPHRMPLVEDVLRALQKFHAP